MLARFRTTTHVLIALLALVTALALSTGVALARQARHHSGRRSARGSHAAVVVSAASKKSSSKHGGSTGGTKDTKGKHSKGSKKTKGSKGSKGSSGGSGGGATGGGSGGGSGAGSEGSSEGGTAGGSGGGSTEGAEGGSEGGATGGSEGGSTEGSEGGSTGGSGGGSTGGSGGSTGEGSTGGSGGGSTGGSGGSTGSRWVPPQHLTWYWQIQGTVNNDEPVAAYDIDGFENTAAEVSTLHAKGIHVICYMDVGTSENYRPDYASFPASVQGDSNGWPGEKWLDIRQLSVLEPIMTKRFEMCKEKGFDAVEPDNMDGFENETGFPLTAAEQLTYDEWVATEVHSLGMAVLQKNDGEQTKELESYFDGALDEQCNQYKECSNFQAYLTAGKPVLNAEYSLATSAFCSADNSAGIMGARYDLELDGKTFEPCW